MFKVDIVFKLVMQTILDFSLQIL